MVVNRLLWKIEGRMRGSERGGFKDTAPGRGRHEVDTIEEADVVGSVAKDGRYYPVLDLDFLCELKPSETEGHFHLYLTPPGGLEWPAYRDILDVLAKHGIIESGYYNAAMDRGDTFVAVRPWKDKQ